MLSSDSKNHRLNARRRLGLTFLLALTAVTSLTLLSASASSSARSMVQGGSIDVDRTDDTAAAFACTALPNDCSLRGAIAFANLNPGTTINVPEATYNLTISGAGEGFSGDNSIGDLDIAGANTTIVGSGAAATVIHQTTAGSRVIEVNPFLDALFVASISRVTISGGRESTGVGGGGIISGAIDNLLTLTDCAISGNSATGGGSLGGGGISHAGGSLTISGCTLSGNSTSASGGGLGYSAGDPLGRTPSAGTLTVSGSTFSSNTANSAAAGGGAADLFDFNLSTSVYNISTSTFSNNQTPNGSGGAINVESGGPLTVTTSSLTGNQAGVAGGGIYSSGTAVTVRFSRLVGNTASIPENGLTFFRNSGPFTGDDNWWGSNAGPGPNDFRGSGASSITPATYLQLQTSASPSSICASASSSIAANIKKRSVGADLTVELIGLPTFPATFVNATPSLGNISGATNFVDGAASATFTASANTGTANINVTADNQTVTTSIEVQGNATSDPADVMVCEGGTATFSTTASGPGPFTFVWKKGAMVLNNGDLDGRVTITSGSNTSTLSISNVQPSDAVTYTVEATGQCNTATQSATLTLKQNTATTDPADAQVCAGGTAIFSTTASGDGPFSFVWKQGAVVLNNGDLGGRVTITNTSNTSTLSISNVEASDVATYTVEATGQCNTAMQSATLTLKQDTATTDPADAQVCVGGTANFSTTASGDGPFSFVWKKGAIVLNNGDLGGRVTITNTSNMSTLSISNVQQTDAGFYTVETTGACGTATQSATLTIANAAPVINVGTSTISAWPPNHQYSTFNISDFNVTATSSCDGNITNNVVIASVTSDESDDNPGDADGNTINDIVIAEACKSVQLRRERDANLNGRVYTITFRVTDSVGNTTTATAQVTVPLSQSGAPAVGGPPLYTVNGTCP